MDFQLLILDHNLHNSLSYFNIFPKVHKLEHTTSPDNLNLLKGCQIITAHSWITSYPSRLLGTELDNIIISFKDLFIENNFTFPILKSLLELTDKLNLLPIDNILDLPS
jgi:hypothetical protein